MIRDKVIEMIDGTCYYILEKIEYNGKKYILTVVNKDDYFVM